MEEELRWIKGIKAGDMDSFHALYQKHHRKLFSLCYRFTQNQADAEEQLQEIFMKILDKIDSFREESSFSTWVYRLSVNHLLNFRRGNGSSDDEPLNHEVPVQRDPSLRIMLAKAVAALPDGFRKVFILHDQEGFKHDEIAGILDCSPATSRSQLCRARMALREQLASAIGLEVSA